MKEAYILLTKTEENWWVGCVELYGFDDNGRKFYPPANPLYMTRSNSLTKVLRRLKNYFSSNKEIYTKTLIKNGSKKWLGYYQIPININTPDTTQ